MTTEGMPHFQHVDEVQPLGAGKSAPVARNKKSEIDGISKMLKDAEYLLDYAAEAGIELDKDLLRTIIAADTADFLSDEETANLMEAISRLARHLYPVTAETVRLSKDNAGAHQAVRFYSRCALLLLPLLVLFSTISFIVTGLSNSITEDINRANQLAVSLIADLGPKIANLKDGSFLPRSFLRQRETARTSTYNRPMTLTMEKKSRSCYTCSALYPCEPRRE